MLTNIIQGFQCLEGFITIKNYEDTNVTDSKTINIKTFWKINFENCAHNITKRFLKYILDF